MYAFSPVFISVSILRKLQQSSSDMSPVLLQTKAQEISDEDRQLLDMYHHSFNDDEVDIKLCLALIYKLHSNPDKGVFNTLHNLMRSVVFLR